MTLDQKRPTFLVAWIAVICATFWSLGRLLESAPAAPPRIASDADSGHPGADVASARIPTEEPPRTGDAVATTLPLPDALACEPQHPLATPAALADRAFSPLATPGACDPLVLVPDEEAVPRDERDPRSVAGKTPDAGAAEPSGGTAKRRAPRAVDEDPLPPGGPPPPRRHSLGRDLSRTASATTATRTAGPATTPARGAALSPASLGSPVATRIEVIPSAQRGRVVVRFAVRALEAPASAVASAADERLPDEVVETARAWRHAVDEARNSSEKPQEADEDDRRRSVRERDGRSAREFLAQIPGGVAFATELDAEQLQRLWRRLQDGRLPAPR